MVRDDMQAIFDRAGCTGALPVQSPGGDREFGLRADEPVVPASVTKVLIALEAETWFADGRLDPRERVVLPPTPVPPARPASACSRTTSSCPVVTRSS